ncbi:hypothetical protein ANO11243_074750 [Dothideomycetidae sp. 11243]|nr:hypothetical protein ANO11243_074750 [fungal sp. No.11243]
MQDSWYPGSMKFDPEPLQATLRARLARQYGFEEPHIDAYYEQFLCLSIDRQDPETGKLRTEIDKSTFFKIFIPKDAMNPMAPNYVYDRMFTFYDTNGDGFIDFEEFISGVSYLMTLNHSISMDRVFHGFDANDDGYISRADVVRMFRAKYLVHKAMIMHVISVEDENSRLMGRDIGAVLRSNRPISSLFTDEEIPLGEGRYPVNKPVDQFGDPQVLPDPLFGQTILPNGQSEIDTTFWNAIFAKHGRPKRLMDLHTDFNETLSARMEVRDRYTGVESYRLSGQSERYLVGTDNRFNRPFTSTQQTLAQSWSQDIIAAESGQDATAHGSDRDVPIADVAERDHAFQVDREERDLGLDVFYQTLDDGLNELFDALFLHKEHLATRAVDTKQDRERFSKEIKSFLESKRNHAVESQVQEEIASSIETGVPADDQQTLIEAMVEDAASTNNGLQIRNERSPGPTPPTAVERTNSEGSGQSRRVRGSPVASEPIQSPARTNPQVTQSEVIAQIREQAVPTDERSLEAMERRIRDQDLDSLLQAAGFSVADTDAHDEDPEAQRPASAQHSAVDLEQSSADLETTTTTSGTDPSIDLFEMNNNGILPDLSPSHPQSSLFVPVDEYDNASQEGSASSVESIKDLPWTAESVRHHGDEEGDSVDVDTQNTTQQDDVEDDQAQENASSGAAAASVGGSEPSTASEGNQSRRSGTSPSPTASGSSISYAGPQARVSDSDSSPGSIAALESTTSKPTLAQLEEWALLDDYEEEMRRRGGPARINLMEFEDVISQDADEGGNLKRLVGSWLEWAFF